MIFRMPPADQIKKRIAFWLTGGVFCLFLAGCALRESELPVSNVPAPVPDFIPAHGSPLPYKEEEPAEVSDPQPEESDTAEIQQSEAPSQEEDIPSEEVIPETEKRNPEEEPETEPSHEEPDITDEDAPETLSEKSEKPPEPPKPEKSPFHRRPRDPQFETIPPELPISSEAMEWVNIYEARFGAGSSKKVILDDGQIRAYRERVIAECPTLYDMAEVPLSLSGQDVRNSISQYVFPSGDKYDRSGKHIDAERMEQIRKNCALDDIPADVIPWKAVITSRCDLKAFPTELGFYDSGDTYYSRIQETELITGFPVWVLHTSADEKFYFVQSYYYAGWIDAQSAALCNDDTYAIFASPDSFVTVTAPFYEKGGIRVDMGVVLPYLSETESDYTVQLPTRKENGFSGSREFVIPKTSATYGFLPYTMKNYYSVAFSFLGTSYGWGGADGGVDCSGFVCSVFRTFGLYLPRNTGEQSQYNGEVRNLALPTTEESAAVLWEVDAPATIHRKGHVMLYLGSTGGKYYVIHAPKGGDKVSVAAIALPGTYTCAAVIH